MRARSEKEAFEIVRRIRAGADVGSLVQQIRDGDLLLHVNLEPADWRCAGLPGLDEMISCLRALPG